MSAGLPLISQVAWLKLAREAVQDDDPYLRADCLRNRLAIVRVLGWRADPQTGLTRPTIARLMEITGLSRRCVQTHLRHIERLGLVQLIEPGTTAQFRPGLHRGSGNLARTYRLINPFVSTKCTLPLVDVLDQAPDLDHDPLRGRARATTPLKDITPGWWGHLTRAYREHGWTDNDIDFAVNHDPAGRQHRYDMSTVRQPRGWSAWRLSLWLDADGRPVPSASQLRQAEHEHVQAEQRAVRQERQRLAQRAAADVHGHAAYARQLLLDVKHFKHSAG